MLSDIGDVAIVQILWTDANLLTDLILKKGGAKV